MTLGDLIEEEKYHAAKEAAKETEEKAAAETVLRMNDSQFSVSDIVKATGLPESRIQEIIKAGGKQISLQSDQGHRRNNETVLISI